MKDFRKKPLPNILTLFIGLVLFLSTAGQNKTIDSLQAVISKQSEDTNKVKNLITFVYLKDSSQSNSKLLIQYGKEILALSKKLNYKTGQSVGYLWITRGYSYTTDYLNRINYYDSAIQYFTAIKDEAMLVSYFVDVGNLYESLEDTASALNYYNKGLSFYQKNKNKLQTSRLLNIIGELYTKQGKYDEALQKHLEALTICKAPDFEDQLGWGLPYCYQAIGTLHEKKADANVLGIEKEVSFADYKIALAYYDSSLQFWRIVEAKGKWPFLDVIGAFGELNYQKGSIYLKTGSFSKAQERFQQALKFYSQTEYNVLLDELYLAMSKLDSINGDYQSAYSHYKLYIAQKEPLNKVEATRKIESLKFKNELENKEYQIKILSAESKINMQKKRFAYTGVSVFFIITGFGIYWFLRKRKIQNQQAILSERLRISKDLHDEIGATLSGISMYSHIIKGNLANKQIDTADQSVDIIQNSATEMVTKLNDIIWLINPQQESLGDVIRKLKEYAQNMCTAKNITPDVQVDSGVAAYKPTIETRKNIYLFCKETINNVAKYSNATSLKMKFTLQDNILEIIIRDDGNGFNMATVIRGNGLDNMQKRAADMEADFSIKSKPGEGCIISLLLKITQRGIA